MLVSMLRNQTIQHLLRSLVIGTKQTLHEKSVDKMDTQLLLSGLRELILVSIVGQLLKLSHLELTIVFALISASLHGVDSQE